MKILCYLPGCEKIEEGSLRRLCVWVMVPLLSIVLIVIGGLFLAGWVEAHVNQRIVDSL